MIENEKFIRPDLKNKDLIKVPSNLMLEIINRDPILQFDNKPPKDTLLDATIISRDATKVRIKLKNGF
jgi:hypothetical protein